MTHIRIATVLVGLAAVLILGACSGGGSPGTPPPVEPNEPMEPTPPVQPTPSWSPPTWIHGSWSGRSGLYGVSLTASTYNVEFDIVGTGTLPRFTFNLASLSTAGEANITHEAQRDEFGVLYYLVAVESVGLTDVFWCDYVTENSIRCYWAYQVSDLSDIDAVGPITLNRVR